MAAARARLRGAHEELLVIVPAAGNCPAKKVQSEFHSKLAVAIATKTSSLIVTGQAAQIMTKIDLVAEWSWARASEISGKLLGLTHVVFASLGNCGDIGQSFVSGCIVNDLQEHGEDSVQDALNTVVGKLDTDLEALRVNLDKIAAMHSIMTRK